MRNTLAILALFAVACGEKDDTDSGDTSPVTDTNPDDTGDVDAGHTHAVVATVSVDYTAGSLATVSLDGSTVEDHVAISTDSNVASTGGKVVVMDRVDNSVRIYAPGSWDTPEKEFSVGNNPQQAVVCDGKLFVTAWLDSTIGVYDMTSGALAGSVDISAYDTHEDGTPEASSAVELDGTLYVGLQNLDVDAGYVGSDGKVIAIDCATQTITGDWAVGGNAAVVRAGDSLVARWGNWYDENYAPAIDGEVGELDPATGFTPKLSEETLGLNLHQVVFNDDGFGVVLATSTDGTDSYSVHCVDRSDWSLTELGAVDEFVSDAWPNSEGEIWLATRPHWINGGTGGLKRVDPEACAFVGDTIATTLPPSALAFY